jgi:hypothetical protein
VLGKSLVHLYMHKWFSTNSNLLGLSFYRIGTEWQPHGDLRDRIGPASNHMRSIVFVLGLYGLGASVATTRISQCSTLPISLPFSQPFFAFSPLPWGFGGRAPQWHWSGVVTLQKFENLNGV